MFAGLWLMALGLQSVLKNQLISSCRCMEEPPKIWSATCLQAIFLLSVPYTQITLQGEIFPEAHPNIMANYAEITDTWIAVLHTQPHKPAFGIWISCALAEGKYMHNFKLLESPESCPASRKNNPLKQRPGQASSWSIKQRRPPKLGPQDIIKAWSSHLLWNPVSKSLPLEGKIT